MPAVRELILFIYTKDLPVCGKRWADNHWGWLGPLGREMGPWF